MSTTISAANQTVNLTSAGSVMEVVGLGNALRALGMPWMIVTKMITAVMVKKIAKVMETNSQHKVTLLVKFTPTVKIRRHPKQSTIIILQCLPVVNHRDAQL